MRCTSVAHREKRRSRHCRTTAVSRCYHSGMMVGHPGLEPGTTSLKDSGLRNKNICQVSTKHCIFMPENGLARSRCLPRCQIISKKPNTLTNICRTSVAQGVSP